MPIWSRDRLAFRKLPLSISYFFKVLNGYFIPGPSSPYNASLSHYSRMNLFYFLMPGRATLVCVLYYLLIDDEILAIYGLNDLFAFAYRYRDDLLVPDS